MSELLGHSEQLAGRVRQRLVMLPWTLVKRRSLRARSRALLAERLKADLDLTQAMRAHEAGSPHVGSAQTPPRSRSSARHDHYETSTRLVRRSARSGA